MRARMEALPQWQEDFRNECHIDPFVDYIAPDELTNKLKHVPDPHAHFRGDYMPIDLWDKIIPKSTPES